MLTITIPKVDFWDDLKQEFIPEPEVTLDLEHSLVSLSKWESKFEKPLMGHTERTNEEAIGYIESMTLTPNVPPEVYKRLTQQNIDEVNAYVEATMTATTFRNKPSGRREIITAEIIYFWMISLNIPFECQYWHLNRLITLVKVVNEKNAPEKKMSSGELARRNRELNEQRKAQLNTKG